jgi:crotonobetainyl-CoA:carnitine CoA-transferase CaiB-like acyl-CoA transferase
MVMADFGAEVLSIGREDDAYQELPAASMWQRGKRILPLDLNQAQDLETLHDLCTGADVLVCNWRAGALKVKGLDFDSLSARHPHLIYCHISGFGNAGPLAELPGYEHLAAACIGRMRLFAGLTDRDGPVFSALQVGVHACAQSALSGVLAALLARGENGCGRLVETSMLQGLLPYEQGAMLSVQFKDQFPGLPSALQAASDEPPMPSLYYHPAQAGDGRWMQFGNLLPHLFDNFLIATGLIDIVTDEDWSPTQMLLPEEKHEAFRARMLKTIQERSSQEWMADFIADGGIVATTYQTTQQALEDPDIVANGHVVPRSDGGVQIGPLARLLDTPAQIGSDAQPDTGWVQEWCATPRPAPTVATPDELPLTGIRVIELATIIAAPLGASFLADMGADVIKVEQIGGDPYRGLALGMGSARVNAGKRRISVDLKAYEGRQIVLDLIADADVLIHNFRPGVPERLGFGYESVRERNPGIVYLQSNGYGPDGPSAQRPSTHPVPGAAMGGVMYQMREDLPSELQDIDGLRLWTRRLMRANEVNPDPNTAMVVCSSVMLGLVARQRTGAGQQILIDMFGANAYANSDDFLTYPGKRRRALTDEGMYGLGPTYRLYETAKNQWVFLALVTEREKLAFLQVVNAAGYDSITADLMSQGGDDLTQQLQALFKSQAAYAWEELFVAEGVGCVQADRWLPSEFWLQAPQAQALGLTYPAVHPAWGEYERHGTNVRFDGTPRPLRPPPTAGQDNEVLLGSLGYTSSQVEALLQKGVLYSES